MYAIINIGSNLGDRRLNLSRALAAVMREFGDLEMSHTVETEAAGYESANKFLNVSLMFQTDLEPQALLERLQAIEKSINKTPHRHADGSYRDRELDIDIVALDDLVIDTPTLQVPHPRLAERPFFLTPLEEIAPAWTHPVTGLTATQMLQLINN